MIETAGLGISEEVFQFWTQSRSLSVTLAVQSAEIGTAGPLADGTTLQLRVFNAEYGRSISFDERSRGFVWFFSFLAYFGSLEKTEGSDLILLLDEPGLSLHGRAQQDLLHFIDKRLAPRHQVLCTTHSPFMVPSQNFGQVRTVIVHEHGGTRVSSEIFRADKDTSAPLLAAMGIELSQTLFVGQNSLLLEGPSDLIYLDVLSEALSEVGRTSLDPRWVKVPVGGAGNLSTFVALLGANRLNVAVLIDSSARDQGAVRRLEEGGRMRAGALVRLAEIVGRSNADIEDIFDLEFYLDLVNQAYSEHLAHPIGAQDLNANDPRIVSRIEKYFHANGILRGAIQPLSSCSRPVE